MAATLQERYAKGLEAQGWSRDRTARTSKYWVYTYPDKKQKIYLGRAGAVRQGLTIARSRDLGDMFKERLLKFSTQQRKITEEDVLKHLNFEN